MAMTRPNNGTSKPSKGRANTRKRSLSSSASSSNSSSPNLFSAASDSSGSSTDTTRSAQKRRQTASDEDSSPQPLVNAIPQRLFVQRNVPAFLNKLYSMVNDPSTNNLIHWSKDGNSFIVEGHEEFAKLVLPRFYKHNTFASFVRQLNMYDFHKVPHLQQGVLISDSKHEIWEFSNPNFQRGRPEMLVLVTRKRNRERDDDEVSLSSIVKDIATIRKHQTSISNELHSIQRDNAVLWEETLTAREKHQRHQEVIAKILQFLTTVFNNDRSALGLSKHNVLTRESIEHGSLLQGNDHDTALFPVAASVPNMPRQLIKEAASLAGMDVPDDTPSQDSSAGPSMSSAGEASSSSSSSVDSPTPDPLAAAAAAAAAARQATSSSYAPIQYSMPPVNEYPSSATLTDIGSISSCTQTIDSATRSVQAIAQDIDDLQMNVEALAGDLGINPNQLAGDFVSNGFHDQFADEYSRLIASATHQDRKMLFELASNRMYEAMNKPSYLQLHNSNGQQSQHQQLSNNTIAARRASSTASARPRVPSPVLRTSMESSFCTASEASSVAQSQPQLLPVPVPVPVAMMPNQRQEYPTISDEYMALLTVQAQQTYADMTAAATAAAAAGHNDKQSKGDPKSTKGERKDL